VSRLIPHRRRIDHLAIRDDAVQCAGRTTHDRCGIERAPELVSLARTLIVTLLAGRAVSISGTGAGWTRTLTGAMFDGAPRPSRTVYWSYRSRYRMPADRLTDHSLN